MFGSIPYTELKLQHHSLSLSFDHSELLVKAQRKRKKKLVIEKLMIGQSHRQHHVQA
jgi:hypothetical protein